jgi:aspartyl-tRNA(Asn)/glutamyl-tRNA(Gln) amidotransferase subunit C
MSLTIAQVEHIAALARLDLTEEEKVRFAGQLSAILDYAAALQGVNTSAIAPTANVLPLRSVMRPDAVEPSLPVGDVLANAPDAAENQFCVPAILDHAA